MLLLLGRVHMLLLQSVSQLSACYKYCEEHNLS